MCAQHGRRFGSVKARRLGSSPLTLRSLKLNYTQKAKDKVKAAKERELKWKEQDRRSAPKRGNSGDELVQEFGANWRQHDRIKKIDAISWRAPRR